jgi:hypothetical protein
VVCVTQLFGVCLLAMRIMTSLLPHGRSARERHDPDLLLA